MPKIVIKLEIKPPVLFMQPNIFVGTQEVEISVVEYDGRPSHRGCN